MEKQYLRNIEIALKVAKSKYSTKGKLYASVAKEFNITACRVSQIYRQIMAEICKEKFKLSSLDEALHDEKYYFHEDRIAFLNAYKENYLQSLALLDVDIEKG